jgi:hypothetical protein
VDDVEKSMSGGCRAGSTRIRKARGAVANGANGRDESRQKDRTSSKFAAKKAASERLAAQRAAQAKAERRRNVLVAGGSTLGVIIVVVVIVVVGLATKKNSGGGSGNAVVGASSAVTEGISAAATGTLSQSNPDFSTISGPPTTISGDPLTGAGGKPQVLYVGAEYCPYCAATRWPLAVALARFGTFDNLKTTHSADNDVDPHTPTLSFHGSSYTSQYVDFVGVEQEDGARKPLETATSAQTKLFESLGGGAYPFIDFGGKWMQKGGSFDPGLLKGMTPDEVAKTLADPSSKQGKAVQAGADVFTAIICDIDGGKPTDVCTAPSVTAAAKALNGGK